MEIRELPLIRQSVFELQIDSIDNEKLINELDVFYSGILASGNQDIGFPDSGPESRKLKNEIAHAVNCIAGKEMQCREFWMFTMRSGGSVPRHNHKTNYQLHPEEYYSIAYYPSCPDGSANLYFVANYCNTMEGLIVVKPEQGKLVVFNSYIDHYTDKQIPEGDRICISANYKPVEPDKSLVSDWTKFAKPGIASDERMSKFA